MLEDVWYYFRIFPESTEGLLFQYIANHPGNCKAEVSEVPWKLRCDLQWNRFNETPIALSHQFHCRFHARSTHASCSGVSVKARCSIEVVSEAFGIFPVYFCTKCLLWRVHVHFDCAVSQKMLAVGYGSGIFSVNFCTKCLFWHVRVQFDCAGSHKVCFTVLGSVTRSSSSASSSSTSSSSSSSSSPSSSSPPASSSSSSLSSSSLSSSSSTTSSSSSPSPLPSPSPPSPPSSPSTPSTTSSSTL